MNILYKSFGSYETNCFLLDFDDFDIVIDPGMGSASWIRSNSKNLVAILNTHGHFDHVWSNDELQKTTGAKLYTPKDDIFMLSNDIFGMNMPSSLPDFAIGPNTVLDINGIKVTFHHFPGHTPGCSAIEIEEHLFSGDFIFEGSIGRTDFPYSNPNDMAKSLKIFAEWTTDMPIHPGHGRKTSVKVEQLNVDYWLKFLA